MNKKVLGAALAATLVATWFAPAPEDEVVAPVARDSGAARAAAPRAAATVDASEVLAIRPRDDGGETARVFGATRWGRPEGRRAAPAPVAAPEPVAAVQAPPLPFRVLGRLEENGVTRVFLQYNDQNLVARVGDVIAENYKVVSVERGVMTLLYIPLNQTQTLDVGPAT